jgi:hypothetical protein
LDGRSEPGINQNRVIVDVGFGDSTEPGLVEIDLPVLLDQI